MLCGRKFESFGSQMGPCRHMAELRRLRLRRMKFVREQFFLAAVAQNIKRLVRFLSRPITPTTEAAA